MYSLLNIKWKENNHRNYWWSLWFLVHRTHRFPCVRTVCYEIAFSSIHIHTYLSCQRKRNVETNMYVSLDAMKCNLCKLLKKSKRQKVSKSHALWLRIKDDNRISSEHIIPSIPCDHLQMSAVKVCWVWCVTINNLYRYKNEEVINIQF